MATDFWFKFNFKDWSNDVKPLSLTARGMLMELIIYMRQSPVKGVVQNDVRLLVRLTGGLTEEITESITEFRENGIFDFVTDENGAEQIVSRRIIKEFQKSATNSENGKKGGNPNLKKDSRLSDSVNRNSNRTSNQKHNRTSNSIFNSDSKLLSKGKGVKGKNQNAYTDEFETFWNAYNKKGSKSSAFTYWKELTTDEQTAAVRFIPDYFASKPDAQFRKDAERYLKNKTFEDAIALPPTQIANKVISGKQTRPTELLDLLNQQLNDQNNDKGPISIG